ncbi:hypothetical protein [Mycolicibacterium vinylchloridicum]|uniref:hypothetical protein n=1 Tax=Mycolicibacterium vinylchloridicum TaxID=2736928 RepID=UPI0015C8BA08|nr:hypothetical protein [Mycolicibacterium vinylchloridicum]
MNGITRLRAGAVLALTVTALAACTDKGSPTEPTITSPSPTTVHTSPPMLPSSARPSPSMEPR